MAIPQNVQQKIMQMIKAGKSPEQIIADNPQYSTYIAQSFMRNEWHIYICNFYDEEMLCAELCEKYDGGCVYICSESDDYHFDHCTGRQAEALKENYKGTVKFVDVLKMLNECTSEIGFEDAAVYPWQKRCIITSTLPPDVIFWRVHDLTVAAIPCRLDAFTYHHRVNDTLEISYSLPAENYKCSSDLKRLITFGIHADFCKYQ